MNYQKLILAGNATRDAEQRTSNDGATTFTTLTVAVRAGKEQSTFFPVVVFGKQAEAVAQYVKKGRQVLVEGRIEANASGRFNVVADRVQFGPEG